MNADKVFTFLGTIVTVALVTTIAVHGAGVSQVITSFGNFFRGSLTAAEGN